MLSKFLDPKNDAAFKRIFGTDKNKDILIHFLNDMIVFKEDGPIEEVTFLKTIQDPEIFAQKTSIVDILCRDAKGNSYIVEMQVASERGFEKRAQYYASKAYISQMHPGELYQDLKEVIFLAIANFVMFPNKAEYKSDHITLDRKTLENDLKDFSYTFLELPKFNKDIDHLSTMTEKWTYFFKHGEETTEEDFLKLIKNDQIIKRAFQELDRFTWDEQDLLIYDQAEKYRWAYQASLDYQFENGQKVGMEKGEKAAQLKIAQNLLRMGQTIENIILATGLSKDEIEKF